MLSGRQQQQHGRLLNTLYCSFVGRAVYIKKSTRLIVALYFTQHILRLPSAHPWQRLRACNSEPQVRPVQYFYLPVYSLWIYYTKLQDYHLFIHTAVEQYIIIIIIIIIINIIIIIIIVIVYIVHF